jgi:cation diffusion facilitator CzcD-associated flavoprotein CzcO
VNQILQLVSDTDHASTWLRLFEAALRERDREALASLFAEDCHWRDLVALTGNITPYVGRAAVLDGLLAAQVEATAYNFAVAEGRTPPRRVKRVGVDVIEAIFSFETAIGRGDGVVRLRAEHPGQAWVIMTSLEELKGFEEPIDQRRPSGDNYARVFGGPNWSDVRAKEQAFEDRDPAVLIVGAGQAGLAMAARLRLLGVDTLVVDAHPRVGDNWRTRYHSLALHNQLALNHMPYMPFPPSWPKYLPKDMLGNWLETYAWAMECNVWTSTRLEESRFDEATGEWHSRLTKADGTQRVLRSRHLIFANGIVGRPYTPKLPGLEDFKGEVVHTHGFYNGQAWRGKRALVLGAGVSAHDVAQDLHSNGGDVTMIQRGSVTVVSVESSGINHAIYYNGDMPLEDCDLIAASTTYPLLVRGYQLAVEQMIERDKDLLAGLDARGFKRDMGEDHTGHQMKLRRRFGGYYLNVGASDLIVSGDIGLLQYEEVDRFVAEGLLLKNGTVMQADLLVTATGYTSQVDVMRNLLGSEIAEKVGQVWGVDVDGELTNMFRPTRQKGLWFVGGGFSHSRIYSKYLALQIKVLEAGLAH